MTVRKLLSFVVTLSCSWVVACQSREPVYELSYAATTADNEVALQSGVQACRAEADGLAEREYRSQYARGTLGAPDSPVIGGQQSINDVANTMRRGAEVSAQAAASERWQTVMVECMEESGFEVVRTCVSNCSQ